LSVVVVDDLEDARFLVAAVIQAAGGRVESFGSGPEALTYLATARVDVVLADVGMPGMDGYAFVRQLRARSENRVSPRAIALTAYGGEADRAKALEAGFNEHLPKPVVPEELLAAVRRVVMVDAPGASAPGSPA
jgi:CheY-like chemotaxis protein